MENLTQFLILGVPIVVIIPLVVEEAKMVGMGKEWSGPASMVTAFLLVLLASVARQSFAVTDLASYLLSGVMYGLAANGAYSQLRLLRG